MLRDGAGGVRLSLGEQGETLGTIVRGSFGGDWARFGKMWSAQVLAKMGRVSLGTILDAGRKNADCVGIGST